LKDIVDRVWDQDLTAHEGKIFYTKVSENHLSKSAVKEQARKTNLLRGPVFIHRLLSKTKKTNAVLRGPVFIHRLLSKTKKTNAGLPKIPFFCILKSLHKIYYRKLIV